MWHNKNLAKFSKKWNVDYFFLVSKDVLRPYLMSRYTIWIHMKNKIQMFSISILTYYGKTLPLLECTNPIKVTNVL
jgi:hypothetical protein